MDEIAKCKYYFGMKGFIKIDHVSLMVVTHKSHIISYMTHVML